MGTMFILSKAATVVMRPSATMFELSNKSQVMSSLRFWSRAVFTKSSVSWMYLGTSTVKLGVEHP